MVLLDLSRFTFWLEVDEALVNVHFGVEQVVVITRVEVEYWIEVHVEVVVEIVLVTVDIPSPVFVTVVVLAGIVTVMVVVDVTVMSVLVAGVLVVVGNKLRVVEVAVAREEVAVLEEATTPLQLP